MRRSSLVLVVVAAACAGAAWAAPGIPDVVAKDGVEVSVLPSIAPTIGAADSAVQVALDVEARTDDAARRLGFRSLRAVTLVNCGAGTNKVLEAATYDGAGLTGPVHQRPVSGGWMRPAADSYMTAVAARVCSADAGVENAAAATRVTAAPSDAAAPAAAGALPIVAAADAGATPAARSPLAPVIAPAAVSAAVRAPASGVRLEAQVAASRTAREAQRALAALAALIAPPLAGSVTAALVQGAPVWRASVQGFASPAEARAFCAAAAKVTRDCWVRPAPAPPPAASERLAATLVGAAARPVRR